MTPGQRRDAVLRVLRDYEISQRRACVLIGVDPKTVRRERPPDHRAIRDAMKDVAGKRRRFGYRRIGVMLERQGMIMNHKKLYRLYREEGLSVRRRRGRKRARGSRTPMPVPQAPGARWSMDFVSDTFGASRKFRILAINDDCCRENLCLIADTSISGARVARELDTLVGLYGKPACIVSDNDTIHQSGHPRMGRQKPDRVALHRSRQAPAERVHRVLQRLAHAMNSLPRSYSQLGDARRKLAICRYDYNHVRPHSSLGNRTPAQARGRSSRTESRPTRLCRRRGRRI
jgi:putative transposase